MPGCPWAQDAAVPASAAAAEERTAQGTDRLEAYPSSSTSLPNHAAKKIMGRATA